MEPQDKILAIQRLRREYEALEDALVNELGAGYEQTFRYDELLTGTGDPPNEREQRLLAKALELKRRSEALLRETE